MQTQVNRIIKFTTGTEYLDLDEIEIMIFVSPTLEDDNMSFFFDKSKDKLCVRPNKVFVDIGTPNGI